VSYIAEFAVEKIHRRINFLMPHLRQNG